MIDRRAEPLTRMLCAAFIPRRNPALVPIE